MKKTLILLGAMLLLAAVLAACGGKPTPTAAPAPTAAPVDATPTEAPLVIPNLDTFESCGHADSTAAAFHHWDQENPAEIPTDCAKCHSSAGFQDFATDGKVDAAVAAPAGTLTCETCHNDAAEALTSVTCPSGKVVNTSEEGEALCMQCHQGRESKVSVDKQIADFNATDPDAVPAPVKGADGSDKNFGFLNVHYFAAGGTLYGSQAQMGYEYDGKIYDPKFRHVEGYDTCVACHDQHATQVRVDQCAN
jgi:uncharacterized protein (DUF2147 family)